MGAKRHFGRYFVILLIVAIAAAGLVYGFWFHNTSIVTRYPVTDPKFDVEMTNGIVNNQFATFYFDVLEDNEHCTKLFRTYNEAMKYARANHISFLPSVQMVNAKCKQFDDGMYAALEKLMESGDTGVPAVKSEFLLNLFNKLLPYYVSENPSVSSAAKTAMIYVGAALYQGNLRSDFGPEMDTAIKSIKPDKPIGFFTWDKELEAIFKQDRVLMNGVGKVCMVVDEKYDPLVSTDQVKAGILIAHVVNADDTLRNQHNRIIEFYARMTNPRRHPTVQDYTAVIGSGKPIEAMLADEGLISKLRKSVLESYPQLDYPDFSLIPYCFSREDYFVKVMWPLIDWDRQVMEQFIEAVRDGRIDLKPTGKSGWYDYQQYALETLIATEKSYESQKIEFSPKYKERLEEAFKSILTKQRETHTKNLHEAEKCEVKEGQVGPEFSVEPLATVYLRLARSYRFVEGYLQASLGGRVLGSMKVVREDWEVDTSLERELARMIRLMYGLHLVSCQELGLEPNLEEGELSSEEQSEAMEIAREWVEFLPDSDHLADTRVAVPIAWDQLQPTGEYVNRYWATAGVRFKRLKYSYRTLPEVANLDYKNAVMADNKIGDIEIVPIVYYAPEDVFVEFETVTKERGPLDRLEFRVLCGKYGTLEELKKGLGAIE